MGETTQLIERNPAGGRRTHKRQLASWMKQAATLPFVFSIALPVPNASTPASLTSARKRKD